MVFGIRFLLVIFNFVWCLDFLGYIILRCGFKVSKDTNTTI